MTPDYFKDVKDGYRVVSAEWVADNGKPDHPRFWNKCLVRMNSGKTHVLSKQFVKQKGIAWRGMDGYKWCEPCKEYQSRWHLEDL